MLAVATPSATAIERVSQEVALQLSAVRRIKRAAPTASRSPNAVVWTDAVRTPTVRLARNALQVAALPRVRRRTSRMNAQMAHAAPASVMVREAAESRRMGKRARDAMPQRHATLILQDQPSSATA